MGLNNATNIEVSSEHERIRSSIYIRIDLIKLIKKEAKKQNRSNNFIIEEIIQKYFRKRGQIK